MQQRTTKYYRKRHKSTAAQFATDTAHLSCVANMLHQLPPLVASRYVPEKARHARAEAILALGLRRWLVTCKQPMQHKHATVVKKSYRQMVADLRWLEQQPARPGSIRHWEASGMPDAGPFVQVDGKRKHIDWNRKTASKLSGFLGMCALNCSNSSNSDVNSFGTGNIAARRYLKEARQTFDGHSQAEKATMLTPLFLHANPLGTDRKGEKIPYTMTKRVLLPGVWRE